jgi:hypothetical protein
MKAVLKTEQMSTIMNRAGEVLVKEHILPHVPEKRKSNKK